jgi:hypothetical protein
VTIIGKVDREVGIIAQSTWHHSPLEDIKAAFILDRQFGMESSDLTRNFISKDLCLYIKAKHSAGVHTMNIEAIREPQRASLLSIDYYNAKTCCGEERPSPQTTVAKVCSERDLEHPQIKATQLASFSFLFVGRSAT